VKRAGAAAGALLVLVLVPAAAGAQTPAPPAAGKLTLETEGAARDGRGRAVVVGQRWQVRGTVTPFVEGQEAVVRLYRGERKVAVRRVPIARAGSRGVFRVAYTATRPGRLRARAVHRATPDLGALRASGPRVRVLAARAPSGARGPVARLLQDGLARLGYAVPRSGVVDAGTTRALLAYRKVNGMPRTGTASAAIIRRILAGRGAFRPRHPGAGRHLEADLSRQVLALIDRGRVVRTYHTSSGAPATPTVTGSFRVYRKTPGTNSLGMVDSVYFIRGYAVHGFKSVPTSGASHGCLRVPIPDARAGYDWLRMGDRVIVYP